MSRLERCRKPLHEFGWLIHLVVTILTFAYFVGGLHSTVESMGKRLDRVETAFAEMLIRGH